MHYLKKELFPQNIVKIYINKKFEGFARLLEPFGEWISYMNDEKGYVYGKQRWLIEWVDPDLVDIKDTSERMTQKQLSGKKCHRYIEFIISKKWDNYWYKYGKLVKKKDIC